MTEQNLIKHTSTQTVKVTVTKEIEGIIPDWDKIPVGTKFTGYIENVYVEGRIQKENSDIFLCQDEKNGQDASDKLGYFHSWTAGYGDETHLKSNNVIITSLILDPQFKPLPKWVGDYIADYKPVIGRGHVMFGCKKVYNEDIRKLVSMLVDQESKILIIIFKELNN